MQGLLRIDRSQVPADVLAGWRWPPWASLRFSGTRRSPGCRWWPTTTLIPRRR